MKKKRIGILAAGLLCGASAVSAMAQTIPEERQYPRIVDDADLLSDGEEEELLEKLDEISERQEFDVAVVTVDSLDGRSARAFADDFYDYNGYGMGPDDDGALLLLSMEERDWYVTTHSFGVTAITDAGLDYMSDRFVPELSDGDYAEAFAMFAEMCDEFVTQAKNGEPYDVDNLPSEHMGIMLIPVVLLIGFVLAFLPMLVMKSSMKTVKPKNAAADYVIKGSRNLRVERDRFLYRNVSRTAKPKDNGGSSTHMSSSGRSHGGGGGKF